jgi:hypothetical protein
MGGINRTIVQAGLGKDERPYLKKVTKAKGLGA